MSSRDEGFPVFMGEVGKNVLSVVLGYLPTVVVGSQHKIDVFLLTMKTGVLIDV
jgi:hypothetical protein